MDSLRFTKMCQTTAALTGSVSYMLATHLTDTYLFLEAANGRTVDRCFSQDWLVVAEDYRYSYAILQLVV
jgi:hypothetical protein